MLLANLIEGVAKDTKQPKAVVEAIVRGVLADRKSRRQGRDGEPRRLRPLRGDAAPAAAATCGPVRP